MSIYFNSKEKLDALLMLYVYGTRTVELESFEKPTDKIPHQFESNPKEYLPILFAGVNLTSTSDGYFLEQNKYISQVNTLKPETNFN